MNIIRHCCRKRNAFSLIETMIALILFSIALLALAQIPALYSKLMSMSVEKENATLHAIHALDYIETLDYDSEIPDLGGSITLDELETSLDMPAGYDITSIDVNPTTANASSRTVTVNITKTDGMGKEDVTLTRVVSPFADKTAE